MIIDDRSPLPDYILSHPSTVRSSKATVIQMETLWSVSILLGELWAQGSPVEGRSVGDVWPCEALRSAGFSDPYVPFHTTTQWLCYSIIEVLETQLGITVDGKDQLTPLTDYPNGNCNILLCILKHVLPYQTKPNTLQLV
jgi:hypothetical protein